MKLIDVSVPLDANLPIYPGNTPFSVEPIQRIEKGDSANLSALHLGAHTGTHVDAPLHFRPGQPGVDQVPLDLLIGRARVIELTTRTGITAEDLAPFDLSEDVRVLIKTSNSRFWGSPDFRKDFIGVAASGAAHLVAHGVKLVGVDYLSVENYKTPGHPAHQTLLGAGVVVVEGLNLRDVEPGHYDLFCLPLRVVGCDGAPARAVLRRS